MHIAFRLKDGISAEDARNTPLAIGEEPKFTSYQLIVAPLSSKIEIFPEWTERKRKKNSLV